MKNNIYYWEISLNNPEPVWEKIYMHNQVIVDDREYLQHVTRLRELIITYCTLFKTCHCSSGGKSDCQTLQRILVEIDKILMDAKIKNIEYTEFVAFWKCLDLSFSIYRKEEEVQRRFSILQDVLKEYCESRRLLYDRLSYTHIVQQALYDANKASRQGNLGLKKIQFVLKEAIGEQAATEVLSRDMSSFLEKELGQFVPRDIVSFNELMQNLKARYPFGTRYQGKVPDLVVKFGKNAFVIEAKHIKESGGAQDKQISEIIDFIQQQEPVESPVHYVAFLDGTYFNLFAKGGGQKISKQKSDIENALRQHPKNFFVNTEGLKQLFRDAMDDYSSSKNSEQTS